MRLVVLDDYQGVATSYADWSVLPAVEVATLREHLAADALVAALEGAEAIVLMRERTPLTDALLVRLPDLRLVVTTGARNASIDLAGARLGVVGLGRIGTRVARVAAAFEMDVVAWSPHLTPERAVEAGVRAVAKRELLSSADVVSLHLQLAPSTRGILGADDLAAMRPGAHLVNTARAGLVDTDALVTALREGRLAGAGLDVFDEEPLPLDHPLRILPNVLALPHLGYVSESNYRRFFGEAVEDVAAWLAGEPVRVLS
jgi:phosphoglycerate dehydrogenase-like enzyme